MEKQIRDFSESVIGKDCTNEFFEDYNFLDVECVKILISKLLGYGIVFGSGIIKIPQILTILFSRSAQGLSIAMVILELFGYSISLAYNINMGHPFSTWGENMFLLAQNIIIIGLMTLFGQKVEKAMLVSLVAYIGLCFAFVQGMIDPQGLKLLQSLSLLLFITSRIPQIFSNFKNKSTGQLSLITWFMLFGGNVARVFTTMQELSDPLILAGALAMTFLNGIVVLQIVMYTYFRHAADDSKKKK